MAIRIAGEIDKSLPAAAKMSKAELRQIAREAANSSSDFSNHFRTGIDQTSAIFGKLEKVAVKTVKVVSKTALAGAGAVGAYSTKVGSEYEQQMSTVEAISGASVSAMKNIDKTAQDLGRKTVWSAAEVGQAMEYEAMAGWKASQMIKGTEGIMNLAAASGEDLASTSDIVTDALTAFKLKAEDTDMFVDVLAATSSNANTNVSMLGESFKYAAPLAGALGFSIQDTSLAFGMMASAGIKASNAGTAVRSWMTRMAKPTDESETAMKKLNISLTDSHGKMKSFSEIMQETRKGFAGLSEAQKTQYAAMLAGKTGMSGLLAVVNASESDYKKLEKAIQNSRGAAEEMSNVRLDNLKGDVTLLKSATEGAGIQIYNELKEPMRDLVQGATTWINDFTDDFSTNIPTIIRETKELGERIHDFAEPFLEVGEWLLDHPDVVAGTIAGIGGALATYKVAAGISSLTTAISGLAAGAPAILGLTAASGVLIGLGVAIKESEAAARDASMNNHFGDVVLSMDSLKRVSAEIVGAKNLDRISDLLTSLDKTEGFEKSIDRARSALASANWKIDVGINLNKDERDQYKEDVKEYIKDVQDLVKEKGYQVNLSTKILFEDSDEKNTFLKNNDSFYAQLEKQTTDLSSEINKKLKKAMKDGFTVDLKNEVNELLDQLAEINAAVADADSDANWEYLKTDWSGKELTKDSFQNLQQQISENIKTTEEGADDAYREVLRSLTAQKKMGYITDDEFEEKNNSAIAARDETKKTARERGQEFAYNTMMDTYGEKLRTGDLERGDKSALKYMAQQIEDMNPSDSFNEYSTAARNIWLVMNDGGYNAYGKYSKGLLDSQGKSYVYEDHERLVEDVKKNATGYAAQGIDSADKMQKNFVDKAEKTGEQAATGLQNEFSKSLKNGFSADFPIHLNIDYTYTKKPSDEGKKSTKTQKVRTLPLPGHASGGIFSKPHIAMFAEENGVSESAIPIKNTANSWNLWSTTGRMLYQKSGGMNFSAMATALDQVGAGKHPGVVAAGAGGENMVIHYSPQITIQGNADRESIASALQDDYGRFKSFMARYNKTNQRKSLK